MHWAMIIFERKVRSLQVQFHKKIPLLRSSILFILFLLPAFAKAQQDARTRAQAFSESGRFAEAIAEYAIAYTQMPGDVSLYNEYLQTLINAKEYGKAEDLVQDQRKVRRDSPVLLIDLGHVYELADKKKKAEEAYEDALKGVNGEDALTQQMATAFQNISRPDLAIRTYENALVILRNPYLYFGPMSRLYAQKGDTEKAISTLLDAAPGQPNGIDDTKNAMLDILGSDDKKLLLAQKAVIKKINQQPDNPYFAEILTWVYAMRNDWDGALIQIAALDERNREDGARLMSFAQSATARGEYETAIKALEIVLEKGRDKPLYIIAFAQKLSVELSRLKANPKFTPADVTLVEKGYHDFFIENPDYFSSETLRDYALLEAQFAGKPDTAVMLLQQAIAAPGATRVFIGNAKLQIGDYLVVKGDVWNASLIYSQVDKTFREDALGEDARFRNARLAYYRGDFEWAQGQLSVLKASTSELIANDALYLSVLITENVPPDSNLVPLQRFAYADLLLFQNKDTEAETLLDSIATNYLKHPLMDNILLLKAHLAKKHKDFDKALVYLNDIHTKYPKDVLGDDAVFEAADINENILKKIPEAKALYEQLILEYPGSTYVQAARQRLSALQGGAL